MANLRALVPEGRELSEEEEKKIAELQDEIDAIWSKKGDYKIDEDAWKTMPIFMETITEEDVQKNASCAAIASIVYEEVPPDEIAENRKKHGNEVLQRAMHPDQVNKDNMARAAIHTYTEGINAAKDKGGNPTILAQLYGNRSLAHFLMMNYGHSMQDAQRAIIVDPSYNKAYFRGAKAAERVRKYDIALNLIERGLHTDPPPTETAVKEFQELQALVEKSKSEAAAKAKKEKMKERVDAAETSNIMRAITSAGIKVARQFEVTSEQMAQLNRPKPYFAASDNMLHVPILFLYDEPQLTDFMQDVACDCCLAEVIDDMMPFPWDTEGRYSKLDDIVAVYKIDDGVRMPEYYLVDLGWPLLEVMRAETYQMPNLLPVFHIISKHSTKFLEDWKLVGKV